MEAKKKLNTDNWYFKKAWDLKNCNTSFFIDIIGWNV